MLSPPAFLDSEAELRQHIPEPPGRIAAKIRPELEASGRQWIGAARLVALATRRADGGVEMAARVQREAVAGTVSDEAIRIRNTRETRVGSLDANLEANDFAGAIFVLPGIESTIRANGALRAIEGDVLELAVGEAYMHCPKAFVRSKLWRADRQEPDLGELAPEAGPSLGRHGQRFIRHSPFLFLGTCLEKDEADVSPRGDPPGFVQVVDERTLLIPDRPGNRIVDSFRNILAHPSVGLLFLVPGSDWVLRITGGARLTADAAWLEPLAVKNRPPKLGIWVDVVEARLEPAPALAQAGFWEPVAEVAKVPSLGEAIIAQVDDGPFQGAKARVLDWMLERDVKKNLY